MIGRSPNMPFQRTPPAPRSGPLNSGVGLAHKNVDMDRFGITSVEDGEIRYVKGPVCAAVPSRNWCIAINDLRLVAEFTIPGGPVFDYFYVFVVGSPGRAYQVPMESLESMGVEEFFGALSSTLGDGLFHSLAGSIDFDSNVMWPSSIAGNPLLEFCPEPSGKGVISRLAAILLPKTAYLFLPEIDTFLGTISPPVVTWTDAPVRI